MNCQRAKSSSPERPLPLSAMASTRSKRAGLLVGHERIAQPGPHGSRARNAEAAADQTPLDGRQVPVHPATERLGHHLTGQGRGSGRPESTD